MYGRKHRRRRRGSENALLLGSIILCLITLTSISVCMVMVLRYRAIQTENTVVLNELDSLRLEQEATYTQGEVEALVDHAKEEQESRTRQELLEEMKSQMASGESTTDMLRYFFPDEVVVRDEDVYHFFPVRQDLKHNTYDQDAFQMDEDGQIAYYANGNQISHKGIDVSKYQEKIDWEEVASDGVEYAFIRVGIRGYTEGEIIEDATFQYNIEGALDNEIETGVYFFTQATSEEEAQEEAQFVLDQIEPYRITYPVVIDVESVANENARTSKLTMAERTRYCIAFCEVIEEAGYTPMIYGNLKTFMLMLDMTQLEDYDKWYAFYDEMFYFPYAFRIWQYTDSGTVSGINGKVDLNVSMGEFAED